MTVGSLFSGIGGFDLGFTWAGFEVAWQVEIDPYASAVLAQHWPQVRRYEDVRMAHAMREHEPQVAAGDDAVDEQWPAVRRRAEQSARVGADGRTLDRNHAEGNDRDACAGCLEPVDVICGGFPCQPHSLAGRRGGSADERDLWPQFARLIRELRPRWVVAENVPGLLSSDAGRFFGTVLGDLAACGYDAEWDCLPASAFGAPHRRDRVWLVAYPNGRRELQPEGREPTERGWAGDSGEDVAHTASWRGQRRRAEGESSDRWRALSVSARSGLGMADANRAGLSARDESGSGGQAGARIFTGRELVGAVSAGGREQWAVEPNVGRVAHGIPARVDRLTGLGNSLVPHIAASIARAIAAWEVTA